MQDISTSFFQITPIPHLILDFAGRIVMANPASAVLLGEAINTLKHKILLERIHETDRSRYLMWLRTDTLTLPELILDLEVSGQSRITVQINGRKTSNTFLVSLMVLPNQPRSDVAATLDTAQLQRLEISDALQTSLIAITRTLDLDEVLDKILESVSRAIPHDAADIMLITDNVAYIVRSRGYDQHNLQDVITSLRFPLDSTPTLSRMVKTKSPIIIDDMRENNTWIEHPQQKWMRSYVGVPIRVRDDIIGFLNLVSSAVNKFNEEHLEWLNVFATQAAVAISNARTHEKSNEFAVAEERSRMAREIHDTVSQMLFSSSMIAESLSTDDKITDPSLLQQLRHIFRLNRGALAEMRLLLIEYKPENLLKAELPELLQKLKQAVEGRTEIEIELETDDGRPAPPNVRLVFYRIAQEALNNVSKHANAKHAYINFVSTEKDVTLEISDKGVGFDLDTSETGDGLANMRARADSIGASLFVDSTPQKGTMIKVLWLRDSDT